MRHLSSTIQVHPRSTRQPDQGRGIVKDKQGMVWKASINKRIPEISMNKKIANRDISPVIVVKRQCRQCYFSAATISNVDEEELRRRLFAVT